MTGISPINNITHGMQADRLLIDPNRPYNDDAWEPVPVMTDIGDDSERCECMRSYQYISVGDFGCLLL